VSWYLRVLKMYAVFAGRARRKEYWMFCLFSGLVTLGLAFVDIATGLVQESVGTGLISGLYSLAVLLPGVAVSVRRLHDVGRSGWWLLVAFVPVIGAIVLFVFSVKDSVAGRNQYGANPKQAGMGALAPA